MTYIIQEIIVGHLVIEKLLKALYLKINREPPLLTHDLRRLAENIEIDSEMKVVLDTITRFNIKARYDDYKSSFYKLCNDDFTQLWISKIKGCREWIKNKL